jgi:hypothetical protein
MTNDDIDQAIRRVREIMNDVDQLDLDDAERGSILGTFEAIIEVLETKRVVDPPLSSRPDACQNDESGFLD